MTDSSNPVVVTGACGLVGSAVVEAMCRRGYRVVATDLDTPGNRKTAGGFATFETASTGTVDVRWADLTESDQVSDLLTSVQPQAVIHLAAMIPPFCYARPELARRINVDAVGLLASAAAALPEPPRFVLASSIAVYGPRNPHRHSGLLTPQTPTHPVDVYGGHKVEAEALLRASGLDWVILRLGGVLSARQALGVDQEMMTFEAILPTDGHLQSVVVGDVATAFANAVITPESRKIFLIGGDETHRLTQGEISRRAASALGLIGGIPPGRTGDPDDDSSWFATDWMDSSDAQRALAFQRVTFPALLDQMRAQIGPLRHLVPLAVPAARIFLTLRSPYRGYPGRYANPWELVRKLWGDPGADQPVN
ncbi:NAD-dependent epimerase/dehydratase family protein [Gordonia sp. NPDC003429]